MGVRSVSTYLIRRPAAHEMCSATCVSVSGSGPTGAYALPACPSSVSAITATARDVLGRHVTHDSVAARICDLIPFADALGQRLTLSSAQSKRAGPTRALR